MIASFSDRSAARQWAIKEPTGSGRLYIIVFPCFTKIGSSQNFAGRLSNLYNIGEAYRREPEQIIVGPVHPEFRRIERELHHAARLMPRHVGDYGLLKEWYLRSSELEVLAIQFLHENYSETLLPFIEELGRKLEEIRKAELLADSYCI